MSDSLRPVDCSPPSSSVHGILQTRIECGIRGHQINTHRACPPQTDHLGSGCALHSLLTPHLRPTIPRSSPPLQLLLLGLLCFIHTICCSHWSLSPQSPPPVQPPGGFHHLLFTRPQACSRLPPASQQSPTSWLGLVCGSDLIFAPEPWNLLGQSQCPRLVSSSVKGSLTWHQALEFIEALFSHLNMQTLAPAQSIQVLYFRSIFGKFNQ